MSTVSIGSNKQYADNWDTIFKKGKASKNKATPAKSKKAAPVKSKKAAPKKKGSAKPTAKGKKGGKRKG